MRASTFAAPVLMAALVALLPLPAGAQAPAASPPAAAAPADGEKKPPTLRDEIRLFSYLEASYTWNVRGAGRGGVNELRVYDYDEGFTFNMAELSIKKDPSEAYPFGFGLVLTAGMDAQKNHSLGIFRDDNDAFPFRNTPGFDIQEAYVGIRIPVGGGLNVRAGKWVSLLGYEVIESPSNLNVSRGYLFNFAGPFTNTGVVATYFAADWLTVQAGITTGSDVTEDNNDSPTVGAGFQLTPLEGLAITLGTLVGPEQNNNDRNQRWILDLVATYTGIARTTLAAEITGGREKREASLAALGTRRDTDASWWGWGVWAAYDWTERFRTAIRQEYFKDADGARTGFGGKLSLWSTTLTLQYKIWRGLVGRLEYRHDQADERVFRNRYDSAHTLAPTSRAMDTISLSAYYLFF
ncbi:MAG TPA: outer membrane beta-barrel protein [Methylomirabilota bacterium]|nr:outer membrane beta-barrel protein [Methylomirabilota bacterium]